MTLHWWMHWFWVTLLLLLKVVAGNPLPTTEESTNDTTASTTVTASTSVLPEDDPSRENYRVPKAIGIGTSNPSVQKSTPAGYADDGKGVARHPVLKKFEAKDSNGTIFASIPKKNESGVNSESKITWIFTANRTSRKDIVDGYNKRNLSSEDEAQAQDRLDVLPLTEAAPTRFKLVLNKTKFIPSTNLNNSQDGEMDVEIRGRDGRDRFLATVAPILQGISDSPRLSRARNAFPGDYQQDEQQEIRQERNKQDRVPGDFGNSTSSAVDIAAVTGSCLATIILIATMGSLGFVMYRRRYMNPPQTLNSDKCSNPDSSGYIDDSTIRDNSEEMYSLDNDSFLNSLEAMTIQNYWTDSVKHTKL